MGKVVYLRSEEEEKWYKDCRNDLLYRLALSGSGGFIASYALGGLKKSPPFPRQFRVGISAITALICASVGGLVAVPSYFRTLLTLSKESPLKKQLSKAILEWNPRYHDHLLEQMIQKTEKAKK